MINRMKEKMLRGEPALGVSVMIPSPQIVEMAAGLGFDWVLIDCEHGAIGPESLEPMAMAAEAAGITAIARPATRAAHHILRVMDRGVMGVQVPHVRTAEDARAAVAAARFHPQGERGLAVGTRAARYDYAGGLDAFVKAANPAVLVCVQIEDREALPNAAAIAAVEGVDVVFVGPSDLSQSMGHPGDAGHPAVKAAIADVLAATRAAGKLAGLPAGAEALAATLERGVVYTYTHLTKVLSAGARAHLAAARRA